MGFRTMANGTLGYCENEDVLNLLDNIITTQMIFEANAKFKVGEKVKVNASLPELIDWYTEGGTYTRIEAKKEALLLLSQEDITVIGADRYDEGVGYTMESEDIPMILLPEKFLESKEKDLMKEKLDDIVCNFEPTENIYIHCRTENEAKALLLHLHKLDYKWANDNSLLNDTWFRAYKEKTCYGIYPDRQVITYCQNSNELKQIQPVVSFENIPAYMQFQKEDKERE